MEKEYAMLREEIMQNLNIMHNLLSVMYVSVGAIITYIINSFDSPMLFIPVYIVLVTISSKIRLLNDANYKLSAYMEVFLEPNIDGIKWETYTAKVKIKTNPVVEFLLLKTNAANFTVGLTIYLLFVYVLINNFSLLSLLLAGFFNTLSLFILFFFLLKDVRHKPRQAYIDEWRKLKSSLDSSILR